MIDFTAQETALQQWSLLGSGLSQSMMQNAAHDQFQAATVELRYVGAIRDGEDYVELVPAGAPTDRMIPRVTCNRMLQVQVSIISENQTPDLFALAYFETLRAMSQVDSVLAPLAAAGLVFVDLGDATNEDELRDERWVSRFSGVAQFRWQFQITIDDGSNDGSWIEKAQGSGELVRGEGDDAVASPANATIDVDIHPED